MSSALETIEAMERPPVRMTSRLEGELLEVSMGPQHPSTHGVFRMNVALEGEIVRKLKPVFRSATGADDLATGRRTARSFDGSTASIHARRVPNERRARRRDRSQAETSLRLSTSQPRADW